MAAEVDFIAPASKTYVPAEVLAALDVQAAAPVDYLAERDAGKPPDQRGSYRVVEDTMTIAGKRKRDPVLSLRRVLVWSSARAGAAATARARKLDRASDDLERLQRGLGSRHYPDAESGHRAPGRHRPQPPGRRLAARRGRHRPGHRQTDPGLALRPGRAGRRAGHRRLVRAADQPGPRPGRRRRGAGPLQGPRGRRTPLRRLQRAAGGRADVPAVQPAHPGPDHRDLPGPARSSAWSNGRSAAPSPPTCTLDGLYVGQPAKPTGRLIFQALARLRLLPASGHDPPIIPQPPPLQARLLQLLDVDPTQPP